MMLRDLLQSARISQAALGAGARLSRGALHRLLSDGTLPVRDAEAPKRIADFLARHGVDRSALENLFTAAKEVAPNVVQHAGADPEANPSESEQEETMLLPFQRVSQQACMHFGLPRSPFVNDVREDDDVFESPNTRYVRSALLDTALNQGFTAVFGESGAGKSVLAEDFMESAADRRITVIRPSILAMENNDTKGKALKAMQIAEAIIHTLDPNVALKRTLEARERQAEELLQAGRTQGQHHVILVEEAHCLPRLTLKHLKRFREMSGARRPIVGIILIGQTELKNLLGKTAPAEVREVMQRCELIELLPLGRDLEAYLRHKFARIGIKASDVMADDAYDEIRTVLYDQGVDMSYPLVVNNLVACCMNAAVEAGWAKVDAQVVAAQGSRKKGGR